MVKIRTAKESSPSVNGGHYMTRGHVMSAVLYLNVCLKSRDIFCREAPPWDGSLRWTEFFLPGINRLCGYFYTEGVAGQVGFASIHAGQAG
jgi:hypothetical protein